MKSWTASKHQRHARGLAVVWPMLALWLGTFSLTVFPELHHWLHEDSGSATHTCLITQLQHHPLLVGFAPVIAPAPVPTPTDGLLPFEVRFIPTGDCRLSPSRAPPLISSIAVA
ncbi:MAG TPA: hypothetical protein VMU04_22175 [Candidatus Acidoferrum sp.]|nr:hypothetical protein [Candidatus Acidoferrum sp.]